MSTIVALSTPIGRGAIAVVRLSGELSLPIIKNLARDLDNVKARRATVATLHYSQTGETLDEVLVTYFPGPHSVTGEDVVEISCHGSAAVVRQLLDQALHLGARMAGPGEFTLRALTNGKIDLSQAEAIRDLINAQTAAAAKQASRQVGGELSTALAKLKKGLIGVIVVLESALEFVEDDLPAAELTELQKILGSVRQGVSELAKSYGVGRFLQDGIKVAIVGNPNVGKSSLFNRLSAQDRAIVTDIPGTTRDTLTHSIDVSGIPVLLIDTAGLRETSDSIESLGIARTLSAISDSDLVLNVVDGSRPRERHAHTEETNRTILVLNKCDLPLRCDYTEESDAIKVSALTGKGLDDLRAAILKRVNQDHLQQEGLLITNARHHDLLRGAIQEIDSASMLMKDRVTEELILVPLHNALRYLDHITGETTTEDILSEVFATFCIGK